MVNTFQLIPKYYFGKNSLSNLAWEIRKGNYKNILILYGGGSIKKEDKIDSSSNEKTSIFNIIMNQLNTIKNINVFEFSGIEPNPKNTTLDKAISFCKEKNIDLILATGGGSVIDSSKVIAMVSKNESLNSSWDYTIGNYGNELKQTRNFNKPIDIFSIITLAGTASENNAGSVITNEETYEKVGVHSPEAIPKVVFEDPTFTYTLSKWQMSSGIFDCFSHLLEQYYGKNTFLWTEEIIFANIRTLIKSSLKAIKNIDDYDARSNILWTSSMALNGLTSFNTIESDWNVHFIEHSISAKWDMAHGAGLALITPTYIKIRCEKEDWFKQKTLKLAKQVFGVKTINEFIERLIKFIKILELPLKFTDFKEIDKITQEDIDFIIEHTIKHSGYLDKELFELIVNSIPK